MAFGPGATAFLAPVATWRRSSLGVGEVAVEQLCGQRVGGGSWPA